jgi:tellurite resistance-related uncharacterized protein
VTARRAYKSTPIFDETNLPEAIRCEHRTKAGTWGLLRVIEGHVRLVFVEPHREIVVSPGRPAEIPPQDTHFVIVDGPMQMQIDFFHQAPLEQGNG